MSFSLSNLFGKKKEETPPPVSPAEPSSVDSTVPPVAQTSSETSDFGTPSAGFGDASSTQAPTPQAPAAPAEPMIGNEVNSGVQPPAESMEPPQSPVSALMGETPAGTTDPQSFSEPTSDTPPQETPVAPAQPEVSSTPVDERPLAVAPQSPQDDTENVESQPPTPPLG